MNPKISTVCKDCRWAKYEGVTQINCDLGLIDKYKKNGVDVIEAEDGDSGQQFFILEDKVCMSYRGHDWKGDKTSLEQELYPKIDVCILLTGNSSLHDDLLYTLDYFKIQKFQPNSIRIVRQNSIYSVDEIIRVMKENCNTKWAIDDIHFDNDYKAAFNLAADKCEGAYLLFIEAGCIIPEDYFEVINNYLNSLLLTFVVLIANKRSLLSYCNPFYRGMVIPRHLYKRIGGNSELDVLEKIQILVEENQAGHLVKTYEEMKKDVETATS